MLSPHNRLRDRKVIESLLKKARWITNPHFTLKYEKRHTGLPQAVIVVSTKIDKRATVRNRLRRQISEVIRKQFESSPTPYLLAIVPRPSALTLTYAEIETSLNHLIKQLS